ncbi:MAG: hypothetical protein QM711_03820 [Micropruina sp.]|uniref:hypothetical protein n=1 Tax=Micropruina sp. TaxID=2737536 RepID=UPI0039E35D7E
MLYTAIGFAVGLLVRSPVATVLALGVPPWRSRASPVRSMLVLGTPNPAQYLPLGVVPDVTGTNPLGAINGMTASLMEGIGARPALLTPLV